MSQIDFNNNHYLMIELRKPARKYWVWQSNEAWQDRVHYNTEGKIEAPKQAQFLVLQP
jgi:hypothetical protein